MFKNHKRYANFSKIWDELKRIHFRRKAETPLEIMPTIRINWRELMIRWRLKMISNIIIRMEVIILRCKIIINFKRFRRANLSDRKVKSVMARIVDIYSKISQIICQNCKLGLENNPMTIKIVQLS